MPTIKVPAQEHGYNENSRRRTAKQREFGRCIAEGFRTKERERRERQEALGIPARAPINGKSPAQTEFERNQRELEQLSARLGELAPTHDYPITGVR
jgi:hypothetical protein